MTNKEFDQWLSESLSSVRPELNPQDWDDFVHQVEESESALDSGFDDAIRNSMDTVGANLTPDWQYMEQRLESDEHEFDQHVKQSVEQFEVPYNPNTWPSLHAKLSEEERLRRRLLHVKILEIAAIFIVFLTFYNFFPELKSSVIQPAEDLIRKELLKQESAFVEETPALETDKSNNTDKSLFVETKTKAVASAETVVAETTEQLMDARRFPSASLLASNQNLSPNDRSGLDINNGILCSQDNSYSLLRVTPLERPSASPLDESGSAAASRAHVAEMLTLSNSVAGIFSTGTSPVLSTSLAISPIITKISHARFGMMAAADVSTLFFPEEHFYSQGRSINFSEKEIVTGGYSAGATLLFDFRKVMVETGLMYSSKTFGPNRNLFVGTSTDRHTLDFENISLSVVSLPLYLHWKIDGKGLWRIYATGGAAMHVIAAANYDLIAENIYTSSAVPNGQQLQNEREVQRVREHMLDGAKFSSKGYLTAAGGFGIERYLNTRMSVFVQPMYQYQIPFFGLIDQNGKHLQNGSLLLGTRISL